MQSKNVTHRQSDCDDDVDDELDPAEIWMRRGAHLRNLRELERQDEAARQSADEDQEDTHTEHQHRSRDDAREDEFVELDSGDRVLQYESYLAHQRYYDDLKHVDYRYIDFGKFGNNDDARLIIEQDKTLGKGGLVWDAAFILGDHVIAQRAQEDGSPQPRLRHQSGVVELGCGTGLCGMMVAKAIPNLHVFLTDLPDLMPLLTRNVHRNFENILPASVPCEAEPLPPLTCSHRKTSQSPVAAQVLDWADVQADASNAMTYDVILGADVVASLYDPVALAKTIHALAHGDTVVYLTFKERLSSIHRQFESAVDDLFDQWEIYDPPPHTRRNRNPDVRIMEMRRPRGKELR